MTENRITEENQSIKELQSITDSDFKLELFADRIEADFMVPAPRDFRESVMKAALRPEVQIEKKTRELSRKVQLLLYSLKVGTAVAGALFLLSIAPDFSHEVPPSVFSQEAMPRDSSWKLKRANDRLSGYIRQFSDDIIPQWR